MREKDIYFVLGVRVAIMAYIGRIFIAVLLFLPNIESNKSDKRQHLSLR